MKGLPRRLALAALAALATLAPTPAQELQFDDGVSATVRSPWPDALCRGYAPVFVEVRNDSVRVADVEIQLRPLWTNNSQVSFSARAAVRVGVGEKRTLELLAPYYRTEHFQYSLTAQLTVGRQTLQVTLDTGSDRCVPGDRLLGWVTPTPLQAGAAERIADELNRSDASISGGSAPGGAPSGRPPGSWRPPRGSPQWSVFEVGPQDLPARPAAWAAIDVVVIDLRGGSAGLEPTRMEPLLSHARQGGLVVFLGERAAMQATLGGVEALEPRMALSAPVPGGLASGEAWRYGLGRLVWLSSAAGLLESARDRMGLTALAAEAHGPDAQTGIYQVGTGAQLERVDFLSIPGLGEFPLNVFVVLLIVFAVVIGPVNLFTLKRMGRPGLLIVTIPAISLIASLSILAFGFVHQGLDLKGAVQSLTLLDQRDGRAVTLARIGLMPGMSTDDLLPKRGTTVHPTSFADQASRELVVQHGDGLRLAGGWAPVRTLSNLLVSSDAPARSRVELRRVAEGFELVNGLDTTLTEFVLRDAGYNAFTLPPGETVAPGGNALLRATAKGWSSRAHEPLARRIAELPATYVAKVSENPFIDTLGLEPKMRIASHLISGILPADESLWSQ